MDDILGFQGEYRFLSNFYICPQPIVIVHQGVEIHCATSEHVYQLLKTNDLSQKLDVAFKITPGQAKRAGRLVTMRKDWDSIKLKVMFNTLHLKFDQPYLRDKLLSTGDRLLVEVNDHKDRYWGVDKDGVGENNLGKLLMQVRSDLRQM